MKAVIASLMLTGVGAYAAEIPQGTHLLLRMVNSIDTRTAAEGAQVYLRTDNPLVANSQVIVPTGSYVQGTVAQVKRSGRVKGRAELAIRLDTLTLADGKVLKFTPQLSAVDSGGTGQKVTGEEYSYPAGLDGGAGCGAHRNSGGHGSIHRKGLRRRRGAGRQRCGRSSGRRHGAADAGARGGTAAGHDAGCSVGSRAGR